MRKILIILSSLIFYPCVAFSVDSIVISRADNTSLNHIKNIYSSNKHESTKTIITNSWKEKVSNIVKTRLFPRFDNKVEYDISSDCSSSSTDKPCSASYYISGGTPSSYIDEYSMFAVIGSGIKLPEEQIESFNGIDD
jgi:hypothetical protein